MNETGLKKLRIFAASPSDMTSERARVETVITALKPLSDKLGIVLEVVDWRVVVPDAGRAQQIIFDQLKPTSWDIFIGILWHRFGTPPGAIDPTSEKEYLSGTEEEFKVAYNLWKQYQRPRILMYRCKRSYPFEVDVDQLKRVNEFFTLIEDPKSEYRVLTQKFETAEGFEKLFLVHLQKLLLEYGESARGMSITSEAVQTLLAPQDPDTLPRRAPFFGRVDEIAEAMRALSPEDRGWGLVIDGIGGIGKTALAIEVAYLCKLQSKFDAYVFVSAKRDRLEPLGIREITSWATSLDMFINDIALAIGQTGIGQLSSELKSAALINALRGKKALLILDNLETLSKPEQTEIGDFLRSLPPDCKAIITSRRRTGEIAVTIRLERLQWEAARELIENEITRNPDVRRELSRVGESGWKQLYDESGGSPLALMWTIGLIRACGFHFEDALKLLQVGSTENDLYLFIYREAHKQMDSNERDALSALSFFGYPAAFNALSETSGLDSRALNLVLERLRALSLVDVVEDSKGQECYALHPLTRRFAREDLIKNPEVERSMGMRFAHYFVGYAKQYGRSKKSYQKYNQPEMDWADLDTAAEWLWKTAKVKGDGVEDEDAAKVLVDAVQAQLQLPFDIERSDEFKKLYEQAFIVSRALNLSTFRHSHMRTVDIITKKRDGKPLTPEEIDFFIKGFTWGAIPDYQASALTMAIFLRGMNEDETTALTMSMAHSGIVLDLTSVAPRVFDKHSSGGVGDKTTLVIGPMIAALNLPFAKMSGRGLGYLGGTLDKLESIPGFRSGLKIERFLKQLKQWGIVVSGHTPELAPADGKLYALRDVNGTVPSIPLIASSIMSKKIAVGAHSMVLDVSVGLGNMFKTLDQARILAELMVKIGSNVGLQVKAVISDQSQPLGFAVGNSLEVIEAIETLKGNGPKDLVEHCIFTATSLLLLANEAVDENSARSKFQTVLADGSVLRKFGDWIDAQGGSRDVIDDYSILPTATIIKDIVAPHDGYVEQINAEYIGWASMLLGGGREKKGDRIDHAVGVVLRRKVGDQVKQGEQLLRMYANDKTKMIEAEDILIKAYKFGDSPIAPLPLFYL